MAREVIERLLDDLDGSSNRVESLTFAVNGTTYEIDLSAPNLKKFNAAVQPFVEAARTVRSPRTGKVAGRTAKATRRGNQSAGLKEQGIDPKAVRAWAQEQGLDVPDRGRVPNAIVEQYRQARA